MQLKGVQEEWAQDPPLQPLGLRAGKLVEKLEALLPRSLHYLQLSDPQYLRGKGSACGRVCWVALCGPHQPVVRWARSHRRHHLEQATDCPPHTHRADRRRAARLPSAQLTPRPDTYPPDRRRGAGLSQRVGFLEGKQTLPGKH